MSASEWMPSSAPMGTGDASPELRQARKIGDSERLLQEEQPGRACGLDIAPRGRGREPAIGVGAERHGWSQRLAHGVRGGDVLLQRLGRHLELEEVEALGRLACASATSFSTVELPSSHMGATEPRAAPPMSAASGTPAARPARSSSAIWMAECAPVLPISAACSRARSCGRSHPSWPTSSGVRWRTAAMSPPCVSPVMVGAEAASPQPTVRSAASMRTSTFSA